MRCDWIICYAQLVVIIKSASVAAAAAMPSRSQTAHHYSGSNNFCSVSYSIIPCDHTAIFRPNDRRPKTEWWMRWQGIHSAILQRSSANLDASRPTERVSLSIPDLNNKLSDNYSRFGHAVDLPDDINRAKMRSTRNGKHRHRQNHCEPKSKKTKRNYFILNTKLWRAEYGNRIGQQKSRA